MADDVATENTPRLQPGERYAGRYTVEAELRAGPLGCVYRARSADGLVALRVFRAELTHVPGLTEYLRSVAKKLVEIEHEGLAQLYRFGVSADKMYTAHAFLEGGSLADRLAAGAAFSIDEALELVASLAAPLSALHAHGILHGNLEPANTLFHESGRACLTDARVPGVIERAVRTLDLDLILDLPLYLAAETITGRDTDPRSDQYSLAAILYRLLAGAPPFAASNLEELGEAQFTQSAPDIRKANGNVPENVAAAIQRSLSFARERRFDSLAHFLDALGVAATAPIVVPPPPKPVEPEPAPVEPVPEPAAAAPPQLTLPELDVDQRFGRYDVHELIGRTDLSLVYRATDRAVRRDVALKLLAAEYAALPQFDKYFRGVVDRFTKLEHPHLVPLLRAGTINDRLFYATGLMPGGTLADRLRDGSLPVDDALAVLQDISTALTFMHQQSLVHLNIKPSNVLFDEDGSARISEVGLAPMLATAAASFAAPSQRGVFDYLSPEQLGSRARDRTLDAHSDVYSLGALLFHMLAGHPPYHGDSPRDLAVVQFSQPVPSVRVLRPEVGHEIDQALQMALSFNRSGRFESVAEFMAAVTGVMPAALPVSDVISAGAQPAPASTLELLETLAPELAGEDATATVTQQQVDALLEARRAEARAEQAAAVVTEAAPRQAAIARPAEVAPSRGLRWVFAAGAAVVVLGVLGAVGLFASSALRGGAAPEPTAIVAAATNAAGPPPTDAAEPPATDAPTEAATEAAPETPTALPALAGSPTPLPPTALPTTDPLLQTNGETTVVSGEAVDGVLSDQPSGGIPGSVLVDPGEVSPEVAVVTEQIVELLNQQRGINGLAPLIIDEPLKAAAMTRTNDMLARGYFSHNDPETGEALAFPIAAAVGFDAGTYVGENLGRTTLNLLIAGPTLLDAWMESPTHRANVLRAEFDFIGVGMGLDEPRSQWIVTTLFASKFAIAPSGG